MRSLKESILDRLDESILDRLDESILDRLDESILGSNNAGIVSLFKDMLQTDPGLGKKRTDHLNKLNDLWDKLGMGKEYHWELESGTYFLKYNKDEKKPKAYTRPDSGHHLYIASNADRQNQIGEELRDKIIKVLGLKLVAKYTYWICYKL